MYRPLEVRSWVGVSEGCRITYTTDLHTGNAFFSFTSSSDGFEVAIDAGSLRQFLDVGAEALRQLESGPASS